RSTAAASGRWAGSVRAAARRPAGSPPMSRYTTSASRWPNRRGPRRLGGFRRRSWYTRRLPPTRPTRHGTPTAPVPLPAGAPRPALPDALTFLSLGRAWWFLPTWIVALSVWGLLRAGPPRRRVLRATLGPLGVVVLGLAAVLVPRPVLRLVPADSTLTVIDYHAHTAASRDGRPGWTARDLAAWHAAQGFGASYVTDHNVTFDDDTTSYAIPLLPGVEWSVSGQHVVALGPVT